MVKARAEQKSNESRVRSELMVQPKISLKSVKPLLPPKPVSFLKKAKDRAKVNDLVIIDNYTPPTLDLKAKKPKTKAKIPGTAIIKSSAIGK